MGVRKLAVQGANENNMATLHTSAMLGCNDLTYKLYEIKAASITAVTNIILTIGGEDVSVTFASVSTAKEIRLAIAQALKDNYFDPYYKDNYTGITVTDTYIHIVGEAVVKSMVIDSVTVTATVKGTMAPLKEWTGTIAYSTDMGLLAYDGGAGDQIDPIGGFTAGQTTQLKAALIASLADRSVPYQDVTITEDAVDGNFTYVISIVGNAEITIDGAPLTEVRSTPTFSA